MLADFHIQGPFENFLHI